MEQVRQVLHASIAMKLYCQKEQQGGHIFSSKVAVKNLIIGYVNSSSYIKKAFDIRILNPSLD